MKLVLMFFIGVQAVLGNAFYGASAVLYFGLKVLFQRRISNAELAFICCALVYIIAIQLVSDVSVKWMFFDLLRYSAPFILFFLGRQSAYRLDSEAFSLVIFVGLSLYLFIGITEFAYASFFDLSMDTARKFTTVAPFDVLCFVAIYLTGGNIGSSRVWGAFWLFLAVVYILSQQSRTATLILMIILAAVMFSASLRARVAGAMAFGFGLLYLTANPEFVSDALVRGLGELVYTPSSDGVSNANIYKNWRGYEIAAVFTQSINSSAWNIAFGHGLGAAINLPAPMQITDEMFSDHVYKIHSLFIELFFKFGVVGCLAVVVFLKRSIVDNKNVGDRRTRLTLLAVLLLCSIGTHGLLVTPVVFFFLGYASRNGKEKGTNASLNQSTAI